MRHLRIALLAITLPASLIPHPGFSQRRAITFEDFIAMKAVSDPQPSPDGRWVAYAVATPSLIDNRNVSRIWLAEVATGANRQLTQGPGSDRSPRWSPDGKTLAFLSTRQNAPQVWVLDLAPAEDAVPALATGGDGGGAVSAGGRETAVVRHGDSLVADNTNVDVYVMAPDGSGLHAVTADNKGADNTPRYSPDGQWFSWLSMERAGFEADRLRLMMRRRTVGQSDGRTVEATAGWSLSVSSYTWCPDSKCIYAVVEERGRDNIYRIDVPSFRRTVVLPGGGVNTNVNVAADGKTLVYLHQSDTQPPEVWTLGKPLSHQNDAALAGLDLPPLELPAVRLARVRRRRGQLPRLDRLRAEVHRRDLPALGRLSVRRSDERARSRRPAPVRGFDAHGRRRRVLRRVHDLLARRPHGPLQDAHRSRRRV